MGFVLLIVGVGRPDVIRPADFMQHSARGDHGPDLGQKGGPQFTAVMVIILCPPLGRSQARLGVQRSSRWVDPRPILGFAARSDPLLQPVASPQPCSIMVELGIGDLHAFLPLVCLRARSLGWLPAVPA